jgi:hypothetical protein
MLEAESPTIHNMDQRKIFYKDEQGPYVVHCNVTGQPLPKITWRKIDNQTTETSLMEQKTLRQPYITDGPLLTFHTLDDSIIGNYECTATNMNDRTVSKIISVELKGNRCIK